MSTMASEVEIFRVLERGLVVTIFFSKRKPERKTMQVKLETRQLVWIRAMGSKPDGTREFFLLFPCTTKPAAQSTTMLYW